MLANGKTVFEDGLDGFNEIKFKHLIHANSSRYIAIAN